ncbi:hypothetical protein ACFLXO_06900 [Chloroflexota bacterium]
MIERIEHNGKLFALVMRASYKPKGVNFITPADNPLQLGVLVHRRNSKITPHVHMESAKTVNEIQEVLHIVKGRVEAEFYESEGRKFTSIVLTSGDTILLLSGGHGFNILEDSKIIEVKQGPYGGVEEDKVRL